jgi:uroporphyrinogen III methyltransferase/synthase
MIYVGKKAGAHTLDQSEINALLIKKTEEGKQVVRFKGGDPFVFGRGGEEALALADRGLPFEVVPGVTSAVAAPAFAGIPVTHRSKASSFYVVTGHEDPSKDTSAVPWKALAGSSSTLVFLMGVKRLPVITANLLDAGMSPGTPAALVRWGSTPKQETLVSTLAGIASEAKSRGFAPPALLVVGSVVDLRENLSWFEKRPLFGKTMLVTRAAGQASSLCAGLRAQGATAVELPAIAFEPPEDLKRLDSAIRGLSGFDWLVFTSVNGVKWFLKRVWETGGDIRSLAGPAVAAIGPATGGALEERGVRVRSIPQAYVAEDLVEELARRGMRGAKVLVPRAQEARPVLVDGLGKLGASVEEVACYRTVPAKADPVKAAELIKSGGLDMLTFTSSSTVKHTLDALEGHVSRADLAGVPAACIGPVTAQTAEESGLSVKVVSKEYTIAGLIDSLVSFYSGA